MQFSSFDSHSNSERSAGWGLGALRHGFEIQKKPFWLVAWPCAQNVWLGGVFVGTTVIAEIFVRVKISHSSVGELSFATNFRTARTVSHTLLYMHGFRMLLNFVLSAESTKSTKLNRVRKFLRLQYTIATAQAPFSFSLLRFPLDFLSTFGRFLSFVLICLDSPLAQSKESVGSIRG